MCHLKSILSLILLAIALITTDTLADTAITNKDVIKMVKSGLGESAVIQVIDSNPCKFDTSANALIALKKGGASVAIIQRVIGKNTQQTSAPPASTVTATNSTSAQSPVGAPSSGGTCIDDSYDGQQRIFDNGHQLDIRAVKPRQENNSVIKSIATGLASVVSIGLVPVSMDMKFVLDGAHAANRLQGNQPVFHNISIRTDFSPEESVLLLKLEEGSNNRFIPAGSGSSSIVTEKTEIKYPPESIIPLSFSPKQKSCIMAAQGGATFKMDVYDVQLKSALQPGEYMLMLGSNVVDFGVDK